MKKFILSLCVALTSVSLLQAQNLIENTEQVLTESATVSELGVEQQIDSTLHGKDIFSILPEDVVVVQDQNVRAALNNQVVKNETRNFSGFRIRIFLSSERTAREASLEMINKFNAQYPKVKAYRTYSAPNFKVSVGNFRNRVEAEAFLKLIKADFPEAFIVRERFKYPSVGSPDTSPQQEVETELLVSE